ncbi:MAG TPA: ferritin-like domain-containing protein [Polyangiaceae bacterium]|nr:ferritin-like domain-containing protein [Polyangiaceae bacterium]
MSAETFELFMLGGAAEKRYRRMRPEVTALPWGTLDPRAFDPELVLAARKSWTLAAYQEHRTGAACAETVQAMITARVPLDLIAVATRFPLDEMAHVEMCARLAEELGGGTHVEFDPAFLIPSPSSELRPLLRAADCVVRYFCVGEALSIPLLHGTWRAAKHPLVKAVLGRIVRDEAAHGLFGWTFLDWALDELDASDREHLARIAGATIDTLTDSWKTIRGRPESDLDSIHALGWMDSEAYLALAKRSLRAKVLEPLRARGIDPVCNLPPGV